jgi:hypothetical protein
MALSKSLGAFTALKTQNITFIGNEYKWRFKGKGKIVPCPFPDHELTPGEQKY